MIAISSLRERYLTRKAVGVAFSKELSLTEPHSKRRGRPTQSYNSNEGQSHQALSISTQFWLQNEPANIQSINEQTITFTLYYLISHTFLSKTDQPSDSISSPDIGDLEKLSDFTTLSCLLKYLFLSEGQ